MLFFLGDRHPAKYYQITNNQPTNLNNRIWQRMGFFVKKNWFWLENKNFDVWIFKPLKVHKHANLAAGDTPHMQGAGLIPRGVLYDQDWDPRAKPWTRQTHNEVDLSGEVFSQRPSQTHLRTKVDEDCKLETVTTSKTQFECGHTVSWV